MPQVLEKVERRLGEKLLLKGSRCVGPKCAQVRRSYPPGVHGKKRKRGSSEYGTLLREKQKIRYVYGLDDKDIKRYSMEAAGKPGVFSSRFLESLERRLDNVVFRLGFAESRRIARHLVGYGHVAVNGKTLNIPSYRVKVGDSVALKERTLKKGILPDLDASLKKVEPPAWLAIDKEKKIGKVLALPDAGAVETVTDVTKIKEFYSR